MSDSTPPGVAADAARPTLAPPPPSADPATLAAPLRPVSPPVAVQALDRAGDIVGVIAITALCLAGKIGGIEAVIAIGALLGVGVGLRQAGARVGASAGLGVVGLLALGLTRWAPAAPAALAAAARTTGVAALALLAALSLGCAGGAAGAGTAALKTATVVLDAAGTVRRYLCARALDPLLGDPRPAEASPAPTSGGSAPSSPPPPAPPAAPPPRAEEDAGAPPNDAPAPAGMDGGDGR